MHSYPEYKTLKVSRHDGVLSVTLDYPPVNLMDRTMLRDLRSLLDAIEADSDCRVVVFSSANPDFFLSHFDLNIVLGNLSEATGLPPERAEKLNPMNTTFERYRTLGKATIAVIEGRIAGAGTEFVHALDMQFAAKGRTLISQFEVALGLLPGGTGTQRLPLLMNRSRALELILGCDEIDAETAELYGCVNRALAADEIRGFVDRLARRIATFPADAIALAKKAVDAALPDPMPGLLEESYLAAQLLGTSEVKRRFQRILELGAQTHEFELQLAQHLPSLR